MQFRNLVCVMSALLALSGSLYAQNLCSNVSMVGSYTGTCSGWLTVSPPPNLVVVPAVTISKGTVDTDGVFTGTYIQNVAGNVTSGTMKGGGNLVVKPDCTATLKWVLDGDVANSVEGQGVFVPRLGSMEFIFTKNPYFPTTMSCKLIRMDY